MENKALKRILVMAIVFVMVFSNCGLTLQALATSDGISIFGLTLFGKSCLGYKAYFLDENGKETNKMTADVNGEMTLVLELEPKQIGYLKTGTVTAVTDEGDSNFEFKEILNLSANSNQEAMEELLENEEAEEKEELEQVVKLEQTLLQTEQIMNTELPVVELPDTSSNNAESNTTISQENTITNTTENAVGENNTVISDNTSTASNNNNVVQDAEPADGQAAANDIPTEGQAVDNQEQEVLVDEDVVYQEEAKEKEENDVIPVSPISAKISSANEIVVENVTENTKIYVKVGYKPTETLNVADLYKEANLEFNGTYINEDLEEEAIVETSKVTTEWTYSKDIAVSTEITKISPFEVEGTRGTLVESKITVNRDCTEENYLPLKETVIEFEAPQINGKLPVALDVRASKLKATLGEEINEISFTSDNWTYNKDKNTITIKVENPNTVLTSGEDIYVIVYRYDEYVESEEITVDLKGTVKVEEYSGRTNNIITKDFSGEKKTIVNIGELVTYSIGTTEDLIGRGKINANYNSAETIYETEFTSTVSLNILTNDILREFTLKDTKEFYIDKSNLEFEAQDIKYKNIKFKYAEIAEVINQGGTIEIRSNSGEVLHTLNSLNVFSQENCEIALAGDIHGVEIAIKDIKVNGTITVDFIKSIGKCAYEKFAFNNFEKIESRIKAEVKYGTSDDVIELTPLKTEKYFEKSYTKAEISMNTTQLSTIADNENVELKIELYNNNENSDLYINPEFEVVFPSYVQEVEVKAINLLYEEGLTVKNINLFKDENNIQRMKVQLEGVQREFSTSEVTNGTNIIINTKIVVDDYTPKKDDQLKMYYFNQGVTNYQAQTDWKISSAIPDGIIKTTNGFDVEVFSFQAPSGFITANGIENYDGLGSTVQTIKQGEVTAKVEMGEVTRDVTMTLAALNNTGNDCSDVIMLGRVPNTEATDVITGEKLGTNTNATMVSPIIQADSNPIGCDIYYSYNPKADRALSNGQNGWIKNPEDFSQVKSFMIIPTGKVAAGTLFKFSYNFQVPANLPYEVAMYGSFGAYYNNITDLAVVYESTKADLVGLVTDVGPKLEASLSVDIGDGTPVGECRFLNYKIKVKNSGSETATNVMVTNPLPNNSVLYVYDTSDFGLGNNNYVESSSREDLLFKIDSLTPNEEKEFTYMVKTARLQDDEEVIIKSKAKVKAENLGIEIESNETNNKVEKRNFDLMINTDTLGTIEVGHFMEYKTIARNISGQDLENVKIECKLPKEFEYKSTYIAVGDNSIVNKDKIEFNSETNTVTTTVDKVAKDEFINIKFSVTIAKINKEPVKGFVSFFTEDGTEERTSNVETKIIGALIEASQKVNVSLVKEGENIQFAITIKNVGNEDSNGLKIKDEISKYLEDVKVYLSDNPNVNVGLTDGNLDMGLLTIKPQVQKVITIEGQVNNLPDGMDELKISNQAVISGNYMDDVATNISEVIVKRNPNKEEPKEPEEPKFDNIINQDDESKDSNNNDNVNISEPTDNNVDNTNNLPNNNTLIDNNNEIKPSNNIPSTPNTPVPNDTPNQTQPAEPEKPNTYNISGKVWFDANKDGKLDDNEEGMASMQVQLSQNNNVIKTVTTNSKGEYRFTDLQVGNYIVTFIYDSMKYGVTLYKVADVAEENNSDAIETEEGKASTNKITIENADISNISLGLKEKEIFDLNIEKYLTKAKVTTSKTTKDYSFNKDKLSKIEIRAKELDGAKIDFEYTIEIENKGDTSGNALKIVDQLPKDMAFDKSLNKGWYMGSDGCVYNESLRDTTIDAGKKIELKLFLTKTMTTENTGTVINKVTIQETSNKANLVEIAENNIATNAIIVSISTGGRMTGIFGSIIAIVALLCIYVNKKGIDISLNMNKKYKNKTTLKNKLKKFYK